MSKKSVISQKYRNIASLTEEKKTIKKNLPWEHYVLDDFIEEKAFRRMQQTLLSKKHKFLIEEEDPYFVQFTLLRYLPLARIFYSIEFKSFLETLSDTSISLNTSNYVQLRYMNQDSPGLPTHIDTPEGKSLIAVYYLSPNWVEGVGGETCLYRNKFENESQSILIKPIENRLFFFVSDNTSWHSIKTVNNWERYSILSSWNIKNHN